MNAKTMMEQLLAGRKVGVSGTDYMYLNIDGELQTVDEDSQWYSEHEQIGYFFKWGEVEILPAEGP